jgi:hypothetical protein
VAESVGYKALNDAVPSKECQDPTRSPGFFKKKRGKKESRPVSEAAFI